LNPNAVNPFHWFTAAEISVRTMHQARTWTKLHAGIRTF
jgi:hypothetical protein